MTFFKRLFGIKDVATSPEISPAAEATKVHVPRGLFVDESDPGLFDPVQFDAPRPKPKRLLDELLAKDYEQMGKEAGYKLHDLTLMDTQLKKITADFRLAFERAIQDLEVEMDGLRKHLTDRLKEEAESIYVDFQTRLDQCERQRKELMLQKDLVVTGDGYIEMPWTYFKSGFLKGYSLFAEEELIFKHTKTL